MFSSSESGKDGAIGSVSEVKLEHLGLEHSETDMGESRSSVPFARPDEQELFKNRTERKSRHEQLLIVPTRRDKSAKFNSATKALLK